MMTRFIKFGLIFFIIIASSLSCTTASTYWTEYKGMFYTTDIARAQEEMPFTIIVPDYMPEMQGEVKLPIITGTLKKSSGGGTAEIELLFYLTYADKSLIKLIECNYVYTSGDPELNPELEVVNMKGKRVIRAIRNEHSTFYFNENGIYYILNCQYVPVAEAVKVLESMLKQL
jgi:hypothetical protein